MTNKEKKCNDCEMRKPCCECKHKDVVIPTRSKLTIDDYLRLNETKPLSGREVANRD